jgi:hypothetical protein
MPTALNIEWHLRSGSTVSSMRTPNWASGWMQYAIHVPEQIFDIVRS